ncbi:MAG: CoA pyrophosphatase [Desulfarculaceae bacterium]|nr:CoA pyrophosphatase [Desulfarculaceae bacterium]
MELENWHSLVKNAVNRSAHPGPPGDESLKPASVVALISVIESPHLLFIEKADKKGYPWRGQMAFPGGHTDPSDGNRLETALRELFEEMGIRRENVNLIGSLGHFLTINHTEIKAFIGFWNRKDRITPDHAEISRVIEIPVHHLLQLHAEKGFHNREVGIEELAYPFREFVIWGVTAKIIHHLMEIINGRLSEPSSVS